MAEFGMHVNVFRILADVSHTLSKCILIWAIHSNKSAEGVSLITQVFYAIVFCTRYLNIFWYHPFQSWLTEWNFVLKIFYTLSSLYIIFLMTRVYARTRERETSWKLGAWCLGGSIVIAPIAMLTLAKKYRWGFEELLVDFSLVLESVCVLPQLVLLRQTNVPTVIDSFYLLTLGSYRALYILNWIWRGVDENGIYNRPQAIPVVFGIIQTALYIDFAWVYWTRQRVKLRSGGLVDGEDMRRGWFLSKILGKPHEVDEESAPALGDDEHDDYERPNTKRTGSGWGQRSISVSADDGVLESERFGDDAPDAKMQDPDELARVLDDEDDEDDEDEAEASHSNSHSNGVVPGVGSGEEWRDGGNK